MLIRVIKTTKAASCPMGIKARIYEAKEEPQEIHDDLAKIFIEEGWGVLANESVKNSNDKEEIKDSQKAVEKTVNKAIKKSPQNKSFADNKNINNKKNKK